ncbi:hypothetical protein NT05LM_0047 [Listeria marthii FSL S4-120]|uniref:Uncharacterized protein n=1 Tax=Listeria marthii FSL S4-120 TaxID=702457 RepID=A0ABN0C182_9LIST|nr:hypothetical protein NT05LM_0047 [Listeria marthii FSL S4-120]
MMVFTNKPMEKIKIIETISIIPFFLDFIFSPPNLKVN